MQQTLPFSSTPAPEPASIPTPTLKLFAGGPQVGPHSTLRQCFESFVLPDLDERAEATVDEYFSLLNHWETLTDDRPVGRIDRETVKAFRRLLIETPFVRGGKKHKRSPATVNKILRTLGAAISPLWPADRHNSGGRGFLAFFKWPEPLARQKILPFIFSRKAMSALYLACDAAPNLQGHRKSQLYNPFLWRTAIVLALNTGPRAWDLFSLRWSDIRWDDFRYGSVFYQARKTAKIQRPPLNRISQAHLRRLQALQLDADLVFPGFCKGKAFYEAWKRICDKADVQAPFESFRKTCSTLHDDVFHGVGAWLTGHSLRGVNAENYQNPTRRVLRAVYGLKNPAEFRRATQALLAK